MAATHMMTGEIPAMYRRFARSIDPAHWKGAVARQEASIRANWFLRDYLHDEYAIAYQLNQLQGLVERFGTVPPEVCNDPSIFPAMGFAAQALGVMERGTTKQARAFVNRVRTAIADASNMHGLRLELLAASHFMRRGHRISSPKTSKAGTFDLLVEGLGPSGLEVECKSISENKGRRIHRRDALEFWGSLWADIEGVAQNLNSGLAVVLTVPDRLPNDVMERASLARQVIERILAGSSASLGNGGDIRIGRFDPKRIEAAMHFEPASFRAVIGELTGTTNREAVLYGTPAGGMLILVMQSAVCDDVLEQVFATLVDSASRQFTTARGGVFWVMLQGIDADGLLSVHGQDEDPEQATTALRHHVSRFLSVDAPDHIVGVVFASRSSLLPTVDGATDSGGATYYFMKEESPKWHLSFRAPFRSVPIDGGLSDLQGTPNL